MIRRRKPHDASVACAAIEVAFGIEQHVLRSVDLSRSDQPGIRQLRGHGIGHQPVHAAHGVQFQSNRIEIGRRQQAVAVLAEPHVDRKDHDDDQAEDKLREIAAKAGIDHRVVKNVDRRKAHQDGNDRPASRHKTAQAYDQCSQREKLEPDAGVGADAVLAGGKKKSGEADDQARNDVREECGELDVDAAVPGGLSVAADGKNVPAEPGLPEHEEDQTSATATRAKKPTGIPNGFSNPIQSQRSSLLRAGRNRHQASLGGEGEQSAHRDHGAERRQQRAAAHQAGQHAVDGADQRTARERKPEHDRHRQARECGTRRAR